MVATASLIVLLVGVFIGLRMLFDRSANTAIAQEVGIILSSADYNLTMSTEHSSELFHMAQNVTPRIITEYADYGYIRNLQESNTLNQLAGAAQPRIIIQYADYAVIRSFSPYLGPLPYPNDLNPPNIIVTRKPSSQEVPEGQHVIVSASVSDAESGVKNATLQYTLDNSTEWTKAYIVPMSLNLTIQPKNSLALSFNATIPAQSLGTWVRFRIIAYDFAGNNATIDGVTETTTYEVVPEFSSFLILPLFIVVTLVVIIYRKTFVV